MIDKTGRLIKVGDAFSQLINVLILPRHKETTANESVSGRCHRMNWKLAEKVIDFFFSAFEKEHCKNAYLSDRQRAEDYIKDFEKGVT